MRTAAVGPTLTWPRWISMGYPMKKEIKIRLIFLFYEILCESRTV